ncbi:MAG TPA: 3,4-dihydroxy-2-butanone-4-phosphate synthase [Candidatus Nanoarchaeia archaeon]|nr:3,4-dihydroxy-2-butanone-4-phosphate synthase [Candidatus Nanoarchaeia archaeon]
MNTIQQAIADIRAGKMIIITDSAGRENEGDLYIPAEKITESHITFMATHGRGLICMPITKERAQQLNIPLMVPSSQNTSAHTTKFTISIDAKNGTTTGISASDRALTIRSIIAKSTKPEDLAQPGHIFPLVAEDLGVVKRPGHTEAAVDLAKLASLYPAGVICEIMNDDGTMTCGKELIEFAEKHHFTIISIEELITYRLKTDCFIEKVVESRLPTEYGEFRLIAFKNTVNNAEELALVKGDIKNKKDVIIRVHSECITSEVFSSLRCDCDEQLHTAMSIIGKTTGIIIYLRQEGRGIGLINKLHAYNLQDQGRDTVTANKELGLPEDARDYAIAAQILRHFNLKSIRLLTNNPDKISQLEHYGITITEKIPLQMVPTIHNVDYIKAKQTKMGHTFDVDEKLIFL